MRTLQLVLAIMLALVSVADAAKLTPAHRPGQPATPGSVITQHGIDKFNPNDQSTFDWSSDQADDFQGFIGRHPQVRAAIAAGTEDTSTVIINHSNRHGCQGNCKETIAHWSARHADAIAQWKADHGIGSTQ